LAPSFITFTLSQPKITDSFSLLLKPVKPLCTTIIFSNTVSRISLYNGHNSKTCYSDSTSFTQLKHVRLSSDNLSYLPVSNRNGATPHLNKACVLLCHLEYMSDGYTSVWYSVLNVLYVLSLLPTPVYLDVSLCRSICHFSRNDCCNDSRTVDCTNDLHTILVYMAKCSSVPAILNRFRTLLHQLLQDLSFP
jgi:hypothetical protein